MTTVWRKGYKLLNPTQVTDHGTKRMSLCVGHSKYRGVYYPPMEEARPLPGAGPLTVFTRKADINRFFRVNGWIHFALVVRCVFKQSKDQSQGLWGTDTVDARFRELPTGTVLADVVLCLE